MTATEYAYDEKPPVCLHILGQGLVDTLHAELRELLAEVKAGREREAALQLEIALHRGVSTKAG